MPSGKNHDRLTLICLPFVVMISILATVNIILTILITSSFLFSAFMFGPDLDIYSIQFKRWGILRYLWLPYQKMINHRSFFSHGFLIGTLGRIVYIFFFIFLISIFLVTIAQIIWGFAWHWQHFLNNSFNLIIHDYWQVVIAIFIGLELGAMSHYIADHIDSFFKQKKKKKSSQKKSLSKKR